MRLARVPTDLKRLASVHPLLWAIAAGVAATAVCGAMVPEAMERGRHAYFPLAEVSLWWVGAVCSLAATGCALLVSAKDLDAHRKLFPSGSLLEYWGPLESSPEGVGAARYLDRALREDRRLRLASFVRQVAFWDYVGGLSGVVSFFGSIVSMALLMASIFSIWLVPVTGWLFFWIAENQKLAAREAMKRDAVGSEEFLPKLASSEEPQDELEYVS